MLETKLKDDGLTAKPTTLRAFGSAEAMDILARAGNGEFHISIMRRGESQGCLWIFNVEYPKAKQVELLTA
jgi:hypothetical protein